MKRFFMILLSLLLTGLFGCKTGASVEPEQDAEIPASASITLQEPVYMGEASNGKPMFKLKWNRVFGQKSYTVAIFAELSDFTDRKALGVYDGSTSKTIVMLQGVPTDTVTYRVKVRPNESGALWSNIWEIRFVEGAYTVSETTEDFDPPKETPDPTKTPRPTKAPVSHSFPEPLLTFVQKEDGDAAYDLSKAATLYVMVNHCEYGEPVQCITDPKTVAAVTDALRGITVTGNHDGILSTGTYYVFSLYDEAGQQICAVSFQDGMLMESAGRYPVDGLSALLSIAGIKLEEEWEAYWEVYGEKQSAYEDAFVARFPMSVFAAGGYDTSRLIDADPAALRSVSVRVSWNSDAGTFYSDDPAVIERMYNAVSAMRVTRGKASGGDGQTWTVSFGFYNAEGGYLDSADVRFTGDTLTGYFSSSGTQYYAVEGLDAIFTAADAEVLTYLAEKRNTVLPDPEY